MSKRSMKCTGFLGVKENANKTWKFTMCEGKVSVLGNVMFCSKSVKCICLWEMDIFCANISQFAGISTVLAI